VLYSTRKDFGEQNWIWRRGFTITAEVDVFESTDDNTYSRVKGEDE
jgi:hypothetical protein